MHTVDFVTNKFLLFNFLQHPRELKEHKVIAGKIINAWARPIFNLQTDYKNSTKEERQEKDAISASAGKKSYTNPRVSLFIFHIQEQKIQTNLD